MRQQVLKDAAHEAVFYRYKATARPRRGVTKQKLVAHALVKTQQRHNSGAIAVYICLERRHFYDLALDVHRRRGFGAGYAGPELYHEPLVAVYKLLHC